MMIIVPDTHITVPAMMGALLHSDTALFAESMGIPNNYLFISSLLTYYYVGIVSLVYIPGLESAIATYERFCKTEYTIVMMFR